MEKNRVFNFLCSGNNVPATFHFYCLSACVGVLLCYDITFVETTFVHVYDRIHAKLQVTKWSNTFCGKDNSSISANIMANIKISWNSPISANIIEAKSRY